MQRALNNGENRSMKKNYPGMFNLTKGLMMIAIMMMHAVTDGLLGYELDLNSTKLFPFQFLGYGSMAMFFMLCGYTVKKKSWKACLKSQKVIIKPYCCVAVSVLIISLLSVFVFRGSFSDYFAIVQYNFFPYLLGLSAGIWRGIPSHGIGAIWFFVAFVLDTIILNAILRIDRIWVQIGVLTMMAVIGIHIGSDVLLPFYFPQVLVGAGYMYAGMWCKKIDIFNKKFPKSFWLLLIFGWIVMSWKGNINMASNYWKYGIADWAASFAAGFCLLVGLQQLNRFEGVLFEKIRWIGRHTMWICCVHSVTQIAIPWNQLMKKISPFPVVSVVTEFTVYLGTAIGMSLLFEKIKRKWRKSHRKNVL